MISPQQGAGTVYRWFRTRLFAEHSKSRASAIGPLFAAGYRFAALTSFANPAVTIGRFLTDNFPVKPDELQESSESYYFRSESKREL
jgi:hypothetical protein